MRPMFRGLVWLSVLATAVTVLGGAAFQAQQPADAANGSAAVVANKTSKTYHRTTCAALKRLAAKNRVRFESAREAREKGFKPCTICKPDGEAAPAASKTGPPAVAKTDDKSLKFSRDIAPILVGNCIGCHNPEQRRGRFDLTTFEKLMKGSEKEKVIVPGKPDESHLVLRLRGEETPKMPQGANRNLTEEAINKIEAWVKQGALLDAGIEPTAELAKVAPTPEMIRRDALAKLSADERDKRLETVALDRWKKASTKTTPEATPDKHFILFGNLPKDRAKQVLKGMEAEYITVGRLLGPAAAPALGGPEKISLYVFNDRTSYVEFVRANENRELDSEIEAHGNLAVEAPYLAALDPLNGAEDSHVSSSSKKGSGKSKREEELTGPERSLLGLLAEQLGVSAATQSGKPPRWLTLGLGAYVGSLVEPRSPYYRHLRNDVAAVYSQGWRTKVQDALGGEVETSRVRAVGFSMMEWLASAARPGFPPFLRELLGGNERLDQAIEGIFGAATRDAFLIEWGGWVAAHYGRGRS
jgi:mono/diheme cytochrome c family protein